jgi:predicted Zn-dependent protease
MLINSFGQPGNAIPLLEKARALDPLSPPIVITLGQAFSATGNLVAAVGCFKKALEIEPAYLSAYLLLSQAYLALGEDAKAEQWIDRGFAVDSEDLQTLQAQLFLHRYRNEAEQALQRARDLLALVPGNNASLVTLVTFWRHEEALATVAPDFPELSCDREPSVTPLNMFQAMNLSLALEETGNRECALRLLDQVQRQILAAPRQGYRRFGFLDAEIYARQGKRRQALEALRESVDAGLRVTWWLQVLRSPHMVSLQDDPELRAMAAEVEAGLSVQRAQLRLLESTGELTAPADP